MANRNEQNGPNRLHHRKGQGPQGVDKAPGEETSEGTENFVAQTQKAKNEVDADPGKRSDRPIDRQDID